MIFVVDLLYRRESRQDSVEFGFSEGRAQSGTERDRMGVHWVLSSSFRGLREIKSASNSITAINIKLIHLVRTCSVPFLTRASRATAASREPSGGSRIPFLSLEMLDARSCG